MSSLELLSTLISAAIVCIIGVILLFIGRKTSRARIYWGGIGFVLAAGIVVFVEFKEIRDVLTALAAIFAAFIAAYSINETRRLRQDNVDRERKDRTERLLDEIIDWAKNILTSGLESGKQSDFEVGPKNIQLFKNSLLQHTTDLRRLNRDGIYIKHIILTDWTGLNNKVKQIRREIGRHIELINVFLDDIGDEAKFEEANTHRSKMNDIAEAIIKEAINIKIKLLELKA